MTRTAEATAGMDSGSFTINRLPVSQEIREPINHLLHTILHNH